jgi:hypothetical protein
MHKPGILLLLLTCGSAAADNVMTRDGQLLKTYTGFIHSVSHTGQACKVLRASNGRRYVILGMREAVTAQTVRLQGQPVKLSGPQCGSQLGIIISASSRLASADDSQAVQGLVRRQNMDGSCWALHTHDGNRFQLKGGNTGMYRDGQYIMLPAKTTDNASKGDCGIGPVLEVTDYYVLEPGLQGNPQMMNRQELVSR